MSLKANVKLEFDASPSTDIAKVVANVTNDGVSTSFEVLGSLTEVMIVVAASTSCHWSVTVFDSEGTAVESVVDSFTLGDLAAPFPATNLRHTVVSVFDDATPPA